MKKTVLTITFIYAFLCAVSLFILLYFLTSSIENKYLFVILSSVVLSYVCTLPLVIATSNCMDGFIARRVLLYVVYLTIEVLSLILLYKILFDKSFIINVKYAQGFKDFMKYDSGVIWFYSLCAAIGLVVILSYKMVKGWSDWLFLILVPLAPFIVTIILGFYSVKYSLTFIGDLLGGVSCSGYSGNDSSEDNDKEENTNHCGSWRGPNENFYDSRGYYRTPDDEFYDGNGVLRSPGDNFYDGDGVLRGPDECFWDFDN